MRVIGKGVYKRSKDGYIYLFFSIKKCTYNMEEYFPPAVIINWSMNHLFMILQPRTFILRDLKSKWT